LAFASRGESYRRMGQYDAALADLNRAIELDDKNALAFASRGESYQRMRQYEAALADFNRAIELDDKYAWAITSRGTTFRMMGQYEAALADVNRALELKPESDWSLYVRALIFLMIKVPERAREDFSRAISQSGYPEPPDWSRISNLALYKLASGQVVESSELYRTLLNNQVPAPNLLDAANDLADLFPLFPDLEYARIMEQALRQRASRSDNPVTPISAKD
jgi:Flp pilus assembly protein TadD